MNQRELYLNYSYPKYILHLRERRAWLSVELKGLAKNIFSCRRSKKFLGPARATQRARWVTPRELSRSRLSAAKI